MQDKFNQFVAKVYGIPQEIEDPSNPDQCMDLIFAWCDYLKIPREAVRHGLAYQVWTLANETTYKYFNLIKNSPTNIPSVGSIAVFDTGVGAAGHVSIVSDKTNLLNLVSLDQNWAGAMYPRWVTHYFYNRVIGWLEPKPQTLGDDVIVNQIGAVINGGDSPAIKIQKNIQILRDNQKV